jgi:hypothetical protein
MRTARQDKQPVEDLTKLHGSELNSEQCNPKELKTSRGKLEELTQGGYIAP